MKKQAAMKRKIRISYSGPSATDSSSSSNHDGLAESIKIRPPKRKRMIHEITTDKPRMNSVLSAFLQHKRKNYKRVWRQKWRKRFNGGRRRKFTHVISTAEEISRAFLSKKSVLEKSFIADQEFSDESSSSLHEIEDFNSTEKSSEETCNGHAKGSRMEERIPVSYGVVVNGEFIQFSAGLLVNSEVPYYLPIVDNYGFLLGEFCRLDDLSICN